MQQREILPKLLSGESLIALGYSEPDAGSDVAAARTRAVRDGDGWRIDGQKIFTSLAEESEWIFLLTRTNLDVAEAPRPHVLPRPDVGARLRAAAHPHAVRQAHEHDVLRRRPGGRRVARR